MTEQNAKIIFIWMNFGTRGFRKVTDYESREVGVQIQIRNRQKPKRAKSYSRQVNRRARWMYYIFHCSFYMRIYENPPH